MSVLLFFYCLICINIVISDENSLNELEIGELRDRVYELLDENKMMRDKCKPYIKFPEHYFRINGYDVTNELYIDTDDDVTNDNNDTSYDDKEINDLEIEQENEMSQLNIKSNHNNNNKGWYIGIIILIILLCVGLIFYIIFKKGKNELDIIQQNMNRVRNKEMKTDEVINDNNNSNDNIKSGSNNEKVTMSAGVPNMFRNKSEIMQTDEVLTTTFHINNPNQNIKNSNDNQVSNNLNINSINSDINDDPNTRASRTELEKSIKPPNLPFDTD
mmetsp:Transcript_39480/g.48868  ORF Transcript_39480/g.48868 Transcript_39480/m.48868 type:complete len:273 (-) Transcript_39480:106-924(-)